MISNFTDHSSNERTFLAWVRTAISIVGFGLAAARLGTQQTSVWSEVGMLVAGALVVVFAYLRMRQIRSLINSEKHFVDDRLPTDGLLLLLIAALFGLLASFVFHVS
mgnify:CR=1 FL=1